MSNQGSVYVQTNESGMNRVIAFGRAEDGTLTQVGTYETGGAGDGVPHLTSQGSVVVTGDGRHLLVTNAGSGDVSLFAVTTDGLELELVQTAASGGSAPKSVDERNGLVVVLNTGEPSLGSFRIGAGGLTPLSVVPLEPATDPAQIGFGPDGSTLVVTDRGTDSIVVYDIAADGSISAPRVHPSSGPTPYGFAFTKAGTLVVTEAFGAQTGKAAASSYVVAAGSVTPVTRSFGNGRSEICWAVITKDDRFAFTTNFADGAVSRWAIGADGSLTLEDPVAAVAVEGSTGLRDEDVTRDGKFLYAVDADAQRIFGWAVGNDGSLAPVGSWAGLPATVAGLAAS